MRLVKFLLLLFIFSFYNLGKAQEVIPFYNQAYQDTYPADKVEDILLEAENAYILFDPFDEKTAIPAVPSLKKKGNKVGAYISIGTAENWRDDYAQLKRYKVRKPWNEWKNEYFFKRIEPGLIAIMKARIDSVKAWGFDWIEFDNMDWAFDSKYKSKYKGEVSENQAIEYYNELCRYAVQEKKLIVMAKNTMRGAKNFSGVIYESNSYKGADWKRDSQNQNFLKPNAGYHIIVVHYKETQCDDVYDYYRNLCKGSSFSFICEGPKNNGYTHYKK